MRIHPVVKTIRGNARKSPEAKPFLGKQKGLHILENPLIVSDMSRPPSKYFTSSQQDLTASTAHPAPFVRHQVNSIAIENIPTKKKSPLIRKNTANHKVKNQDWAIKDANHLYGIKNWGGGYFSINKKGQVVVHPKKDHPEQQVALYDLISDLKERGIRTPTLIRFMDIVDERVHLINRCFQQAIEKYEYKNKYQGVYPIKVNQQRHVVEQTLKSGAKYDLGLECGSKPELLVALAMMHKSKGLLICNGFKDLKYIETALLSQKLGRNTIIVVEKIEDLHLIIDVSKKLNITPQIGIRSRLDSIASGRWKKSSGRRSKFGLTSAEIVKCIKTLKQQNLLSSLKLLHFHIGSQIPSIFSIKRALTEGSRYYTELCKMGVNIKYIDVGGGLGVNYGTPHSNSESAINYSEQEYANDVVFIIQSICDEMKIPHPVIVSESGRMMTAHHSVLICDVLSTSAEKHDIAKSIINKNEPLIIQDLYETYETLSSENLIESFNDLQQYKVDISQLFTYGMLNLKQKALAEKIIYLLNRKIAELAQQEKKEDVLKILEQDLMTLYFTNFSVFQSVPDSWATQQIFPVIPIQQLDEKPEELAVLSDLTCDCDGKIDRFIQKEEISNSLKLHKLTKNKPYYLGIFLVGAYQEILGDLHNLFGDTDAVSVLISKNGYHLTEVEEGDTIIEILNYIQYNRIELIQKMRRSIESSIEKEKMSKSDAYLLMRNYEEVLSGYSYLESPKKV